MNEAQRKRTLGDILEEFEAALLGIGEADGEVTDELFEQLENAEEAFTEKVDRCLLVREKLQAQADMYKERAKRLAAYATVVQKRADWLKEYVFGAMQRLDIEKIENLENFVYAQVRNTAAKVAIENDSAFIDRYRHTDLVRVKLEIDKTRVKEHLTADRPIDGARLVHRKALYVK